MNKTLDSRHRPLLVLVLIGLLLMFGSAGKYWLEHPSLVMHRPQAEAEKTVPNNSAMSGMSGISENMVKLMQRLQENPADKDALLNLAEYFMHQEDWNRAEQFAMRAVATAPSDPQPLYTLGIIQHRLERHAEAAANLRQALLAGENPSIRYSLGLLTAWYLDKKEEGLLELQKVVDNPSAPAEVKQSTQAEIAKIKEAISQKAPSKQENSKETK